MKKILLSLIAVISLQAADVTSVSLDRIKFYPEKDSKQCDTVKNLVEEAYDSKFKTDKDAAKFFLKEIKKNNANDCEIYKDGAETNIVCKTNQTDLVFFSDKKSCEKWQAKKPEVKEDIPDVSLMVNNPDLFTYMYNPNDDTCFVAKEAFNAMMSEDPSTKRFVAKTQQDYVTNMSMIWMLSAKTINFNVMEQVAVSVGVTDKEGEEISYFFANNSSNCEALRKTYKEVLK